MFQIKYPRDIMNSSKFSSVILISLLIILITSQSCMKRSIDEVKIPDLKTLESQFQNPPAEYSPAPFFVWNAKITNEEIDNFMVSFNNAGTSQLFIHPRPGLITEYLSENWFELYRHTVEKGKELGMDVWIYDENSYPSGFAGGHVPNDMPESYNQGQGLIMTRFKSLPDTSDKYYLCLKEDDGKYTDITSSLSAEKGKSGKYLLFSKTYYAKSDWYGGFSYVDLLHRGVTQKFINLTMDGYEKYIGNEFGKTVPGIFTDEPHINSPGGIRWTPDLFDNFKEQWQYDLRTQLPSLYEEVGDWKKVRHNYTQTLLTLFIDRWAKPWYEYCEEKGLKFTGHYWEHEWPDMKHGGDNMAMYAWHQVPAIDMLFNQWNDSTTQAQFGNIRSVKELASAANQTGRLRKLSETYGGSGWDLTFTEMKRNGDWEYALGVNLMNQHLTYFTLAGARKYDYPPSFDYHEPWWNDYKYINDHYARLSLALSAGRQINDMLIIEPTTSAWLYDSYATKNMKYAKIGQAFQSFITILEKNQVEYDLGSENIIKNMGSVSKGKFIVGEASYSRVVIPPMTENLDMATFLLIKRFISGGGTLIAFSEPTLVDGSNSTELKELFENNTDNVVFPDILNPEIISKYFYNINLIFDGIAGGALYHHRRMLSDGQILFLANSSLKESVKGSVISTAKDVIELNTFTGEVVAYPSQQVDDKINFAYSIPPAGSLLLFLSDAKIKDYPIPATSENLKAVQSTSQIKTTRDKDNAIMIDFCDVLNGDHIDRDIHVVTAADNVFKYYGFKNGNPWNHSVQYLTNIIDRDTFGINTGFTASYHFTIKGKFDYSSLKAVVERPDIWTVTVNGFDIETVPGEWWLDHNLGIFNIGSYVKIGENTINVKTSPMKIHAEIEPVYITGDFSVEPAIKGFVITAPGSDYSLGSWIDQGLPFYPWGMTYSKEYEIDNLSDKYEVELDDWKGTVAEVIVNGEPAGIIGFPPYRADVTEFIRQGANKIDIRVIGSLKNLLGPHHNNPPVGLASPGNWRNVKDYPPGKDYQMLDYGLFGDIVLYNGD